MRNIRNICNNQIGYNYTLEFESDSDEEKSYKIKSLFSDRASSFNECNALFGEEYNYLRTEFNSSLQILPDKNNNIFVPENKMNKDSNINGDIFKISEKNVASNSINNIQKSTIQIENCQHFSIKNSYSFPVFLNRLYCYYEKKFPLFYIEKRTPKIRKADICKVVNSNKLIKEVANININERFRRRAKKSKCYQIFL